MSGKLDMRTVSSAIGFALIIFISLFHPISSFLSINRSLLPILLFIVFDAVRPLGDLFRESFSAVAGAVVGSILSIIPFMSGSSLVRLFGFIILNFLFGLYRMRAPQRHFAASVTASIATQVILVMSDTNMIELRTILQFVTVFSTSSALVFLTSAIAFPPSSSHILRKQIHQSMRSVQVIIPHAFDAFFTADLALAKTDLAAFQTANEQLDLETLLNDLSNSITYLRSLTRSASLELYLAKMPLSACRELSYLIQDMIDQLYGISYWRHCSLINLPFDIEDAIAVRERFRQPVSCLCQSVDDLLADAIAVYSLNSTCNTPSPPSSHKASRVRADLDALDKLVANESAFFKENPTNAFGILIFVFRLTTVANSALQIHRCIADNSPARARLQWPSLDVVHRYRRSVDYGFLSEARLRNARYNRRVRRCCRSLGFDNDQGRRDAVFAVKLMLALCVEALPAFFVRSRPFFLTYIGTWTMITSSVIMTPTLGGVNAAVTFRIIGSLIGAIVGLIAVVIGGDNAVVLAAISLIFALVTYYFRLGASPHTKSMSISAQLTFGNIIINTVGRLRDPLLAADPLWTATLNVCVQTLIALMISWTFMIVISPILARDSLRSHLAGELVCLGILYGRILHQCDDDHVLPLHKHILRLHRTVLLPLFEQAQAEPSLFGDRFPKHQYADLLSATRRLLERMELCRQALGCRPISGFDPTVAAEVANRFYILATVLYSGTPMPPLPFQELSLDYVKTVAFTDGDGDQKTILEVIWRAAFALSANDINQKLEQVRRVMESLGRGM